MKRKSNPAGVHCVVSFLSFLALGCAGQGERGEPSSQLVNGLDDGVYPVLRQENPADSDLDLLFVRQAIRLPNPPIGGGEPKPIWVSVEPLLLFKEATSHEFKLDSSGECTTVVLNNTEALKSFTRKHVGKRLAVVIGEKVTTHHKIREALESDLVNVTFCTEGGGDHLMKHLRKVLP